LLRAIFVARNFYAAADVMVWETIHHTLLFIPVPSRTVRRRRILAEKWSVSTVKEI
jgi:hypothetical protein